MPPTASAFTRSYNSFSGVDIKAVFASKVIGELQAISYSITREKAPIYTMGSADPRSFSRGKRGIAGSLIFIMFDSHPLLNALAAPADGLKFQSDVEDVRPAFETEGALDVSQPLRLAGLVAAAPGTATVARQETELTTLASDQMPARPWYVDQMPPFDVTLAAANEYGAMAVMRIYGVELLNEGYGVSIDDIVSEQQMTYVARTIMPWASVPNVATQTAVAGAV